MEKSSRDYAIMRIIRIVLPYFEFTAPLAFVGVPPLQLVTLPKIQKHDCLPPLPVSRTISVVQTGSRNDDVPGQLLTGITLERVLANCLPKMLIWQACNRGPERKTDKPKPGR